MSDSITYILTLYLSAITTGILILAALAHMVYQRREPPSMIAWILAISLLPYIAVPFYFVLRSRKLMRKPKSHIELACEGEVPIGKASHIDMILRENGVAGATNGNTFELYTDGVDVYTLLLEEIQKAEKQIFISTYVFSSDEVGKSIIAKLCQKASQGVDVKLLIDSIGSLPLYLFQGPLRKLTKSGGHVAFYMPLLGRPFQNYVNLRNHRKIFLFDNKTVLAGGMNLSSKYMGPAPYDDRWQDILFSIQGPAVFHYGEIFTEDWNFTAQTKLSLYKQLPSPVGDTRIQVVPSGPDIKTDALYEALLSAIFSAKHRIWIVTPYFVPDKSLMQALVIAHHRGVDIKLITPAKSNHLFADLGRSSYMRDLYNIGIEVCLLPTGMIHAKAILFDEEGVMMGSANIDQRSLFLNYEVVSFIYSKKSIAASEKWMRMLLEKCDGHMKPAGKLRKIGENLMNIFAPLL
ncbi:MAG: phospholipase D-like domain-containing protein [Desulfobacula sp.]|jgi:cardiolipin synthase|nr:phospholipase D-like domain-containing protein [Desulfobacula sp.]